MLKPKIYCPACGEMALSIKDKILQSRVKFQCKSCDQTLLTDKAMVFIVMMIIIIGLLVSKRIVGLPISIGVAFIFSLIVPLYTVGIYKSGDKAGKSTYVLVGVLVSLIVIFSVFLLSLGRVVFGA